MLPIRWILAPVTLVFAIALLPRAFVAVGFPAPEKRASESPAQSKLQDRFIPGSVQYDQLMSPPEPAHYLTVASGNSQGESDLTGTVAPNDTPLAAEFPVDVSILYARTKPAKQEDHQIRAARSKVPARSSLCPILSSTVMQSASSTSSLNGPFLRYMDCANMWQWAA